MLNSIFENKKCVWKDKNCPVIKKKAYCENNFYVDNLSLELGLKKKDILRSFRSKICSKCKCIVNTKWFKPEISEHLYNSIYGQHHKGWLYYYNFVKQKKTTHNKVFNFIFNNIKINDYGEYNCPFTGFMFHFLKAESKPVLKAILNNHINYLKILSNKQLAHLDSKTIKYKNAINKKNYNFHKIGFQSQIKKYLLLDNSKKFWNYNCISKGNNCRVVGKSLLDFKILDSLNNKNRFDLFSLFFTLDHAEDPKKLINYTLERSKLVLIHSHVHKSINPQHQFTLTGEFKFFLESQNIHVIDLSNLENKKNEIYLLCSLNKKKINKIKSYL
jgi:hypothetical protein